MVTIRSIVEEGMGRDYVSGWVSIVEEGMGRDYSVRMGLVRKEWLQWGYRSIVEEGMGRDYVSGWGYTPKQQECQDKLKSAENEILQLRQQLVLQSTLGQNAFLPLRNTDDKSCENIEHSQAKSIMSITCTSNTCSNTENKNINEENSEISTKDNSNIKKKEDIKEIHSDTVRQPLQNVNELLHARENITQDENSVKSLLHQLLDKTDSLFELVKSIDKQCIEDKQDFQNKIDQVNDRITAFSKKMCTIDEHQTQHLYDIENSVKLVKVDQDKNFSHVHNKIQSLADRVKDLPSRTQYNAKNFEVEKSNENIDYRSVNSNTANTSKTYIDQSHTTIRNSQIFPDERKEKTLIIGSSIIKGIDANKVGKDVHIRTNRGATVPTLTEKIKKSNIQHYKSIILVVGGNDASSRIHPEAFKEKYDDMIKTVKSINPGINIAVSEICPRRNVDTEIYNAILHRVSTEHKLKIIKQTDAFVSRGGDLVSSYYHRDGIHLTNQGTILLLRNINKVVNIFNQTTISQSNNESNEQHGKRQTIANTFNGICFNCGFYGHHCKDCHTL
ncbi:unnamed protein product [Mytilus edulis]|uniref:CCHC-type domain-containing protein n=1 Tax=Mytilus edulis TaxID=6550 RepID=A0A8S3UZ30_MYTED|nr:unnamed protein product [Mytilus edulis]